VYKTFVVVMILVLAVLIFAGASLLHGAAPPSRATYEWSYDEGGHSAQLFLRFPDGDGYSWQRLGEFRFESLSYHPRTEEGYGPPGVCPTKNPLPLPLEEQNHGP
jgi:hypothetical protein